MTNLKFPILYIGKKGISAIGSMKTTSIVGAPYIHEEWWKERTIIDANGQEYEISNISVIGNASWWPHIFTSPSRRTYKAKYKLQAEEKMDLEQTKKLVIKILKSNKEAWKYIEECNSINEIMESMHIMP